MRLPVQPRPRRDTAAPLRTLRNRQSQRRSRGEAARGAFTVTATSPPHCTRWRNEDGGRDRAQPVSPCRSPPCPRRSRPIPRRLDRRLPVALQLGGQFGRRAHHCRRRCRRRLSNAIEISPTARHCPCRCRRRLSSSHTECRAPGPEPRDCLQSVSVPARSSSRLGNPISYTARAPVSRSRRWTEKPLLLRPATVHKETAALRQRRSRRA
jgi:hypothetical protein